MFWAWARRMFCWEAVWSVEDGTWLESAGKLQPALGWLVLHDSWDTKTGVRTEKAVNKKIYLNLFSIVWDKLYVFVYSKEDNIFLLWAGKDWLGDSEFPEAWSSDFHQWWMTKCPGERDGGRIDFHKFHPGFFSLQYYHRYILHHRNCLKRRIRILHWMPTPRKWRSPSQSSSPLKQIHQHLDSKRSERSSTLYIIWEFLVKILPCSNIKGWR